MMKSELALKNFRFKKMQIDIGRKNKAYHFEAVNDGRTALCHPDDRRDLYRSEREFMLIKEALIFDEDFSRWSK